MDELVLEGPTRLRGTLTPSGNKNAAFPLIAAALLTDQPLTLRNLPDISDVRTMLGAVESLGVSVARADRHTVTLHARALATTAPAQVAARPSLRRNRRRASNEDMASFFTLPSLLRSRPDSFAQRNRLQGWRYRRR